MTDEQHAEEASKGLNVVLEEASAEPETKVETQETTPEVETAPTQEEENTTLQETIKSMQKEIADNKEYVAELKDQAGVQDQYSVSDLVELDTALTPEVNSEDLNFGDIYEDPAAFQKNLQSYLKGHDKDVAEAAVEKVLNSDRIKALENTTYTREHERALEKSQKTFGDRFEYSDKHVAMQRKLPGLAVEDAHRLEDYDRLLAEVNQVKEEKAERANTQSIPSSSTRMVANTDDGKITVKLSAGEKAAADKYFNGDYAKYARGKHRQDNN